MRRLATVICVTCCTVAFWCPVLAQDEPQTDQVSRNIALDGVAKSWLPNSVASVPTSLVNDGDPLTFWGSNAPSMDPPKDIGIEWESPQRFGAVLVKFYSLYYCPARDGWRLEARSDGEWTKLDAAAENTDCPWWVFQFEPTRADALRLVVDTYRLNRVAVSEFEVYEAAPPGPKLRRAPILDGAFWAFEYEHWAGDFPTDEAIAAEAGSAHAIGLDIIILYTITGRDGVFSTAVPGTVIPQSNWWAGRDPVQAVLARADDLGMRVYLTDTSPTGFSRPVEPDREKRSGDLLQEYRKQALDRYAKHPSLAGYYINYECLPDYFNNKADIPASNSQQLAAFIKANWPKLHVVQPVGLYRWRQSKQARWHHVKPDELESFWRPYIAHCADVDAFMVIDGVGTGLAPLNFTDANQRRIRALCDELSKEMWTDVEVAEMGARYEPMPIGRVAASLRVAAHHAQTIVGFCYFNYMSPNNGRELSARLYNDYRAYRFGEHLLRPGAGRSRP